MKTNITKNLLIDIGEAHGDRGAWLVRIEARAAADGEILSAVTISTEASGKAESVSMPADIIERVAKALSEYRRAQNDYRSVCADHGYLAPHTYRCAKCEPASEGAEEVLVMPASAEEVPL